MTPIKTVVIADGQPLFRQALRSTVTPLFGAVDMLELDSLRATLAVLAQRRVDLPLLDLQLKVAGGLQGLATVRKSHPEVPVFAVSAGNRVETLRAAMRSGASGCILRSASSVQIWQAVALVIRGNRAVPTLADTPKSGAERRLLDAMENIDLLNRMQRRVQSGQGDRRPAQSGDCPATVSERVVGEVPCRNGPAHDRRRNQDPGPAGVLGTAQPGTLPRIVAGTNQARDCGTLLNFFHRLPMVSVASGQALRDACRAGYLANTMPAVPFHAGPFDPTMTEKSTGDPDGQEKTDHEDNNQSNQNNRTSVGAAQA